MRMTRNVFHFAAGSDLRHVAQVYGSMLDMLGFPALFAQGEIVRFGASGDQATTLEAGARVAIIPVSFRGELVMALNPAASEGGQYRDIVGSGHMPLFRATAMTSYVLEVSQQLEVPGA